VSHKTWQEGAFFTPEFIADNSWNGYEHDVLFRNDEDGRRFTDIAHVTGIDLDSDGRGLTYIDFDGDGDLDVVVVGHRQKARLLRNDIGQRNNWLKVELVGTRSNRFGVGARVTVRAAGRSQMREVRAGGGFLSSYSGPVPFGLGQAAAVDEVLVRWPGGITQRLTGVAVNQKVRIVEPES
jgi:hypothetical protein